MRAGYDEYPARYIVFMAEAESILSTWYKLCLGIVAMILGLLVLKIALSYAGSPFLNPFYSFLALVVVSVGIYYLLFTILSLALKRLRLQDK